MKKIEWQIWWNGLSEAQRRVRRSMWFYRIVRLGFLPDLEEL